MAVPTGSGLRIDRAIPVFDVKPSIGLLATGYRKFSLDIRSFREPLKRSIQQVIAPSIVKNFDVGGRPDVWEPLSEYALDRRAREGFNDKPLVKTGKLRRTMGQLNIWTITRESASIRDLPPNVWYGKVQNAGIGQFSTRIAAAGGDTKAALEKLRGRETVGAHIPQRRFIMIQDEDVPKIEAVFQKWLAERWTASGRV